MSRYPFSQTGKKANVILAFLAGAAVLGTGIYIGSTITKSAYEDILKSGD